jgi:hypothetical protein
LITLPSSTTRVKRWIALVGVGFGAKTSSMMVETGLPTHRLLWKSIRKLGSSEAVYAPFADDSTRQAGSPTANSGGTDSLFDQTQGTKAT